VNTRSEHVEKAIPEGSRSTEAMMNSHSRSDETLNDALRSGLSGGLSGGLSSGLSNASAQMQSREQQRRRLALIFLVALLDILAFSVLLPVLSYYATTFGATPTQIGLMSGTYALCQMLAAPVMARLSDRYGRKKMLLLDISGSIIGLLLLGFASSLWMLFASRVISGLVAANIPIAQAYIADTTDAAERSRSIGLLGVAFGLGFTVGPALGGILSKSGTQASYAHAALLSVGFAALNWLLVAFLLKDVRQQERKAEAVSSAASSVTVSFALPQLRRVLTGRRVAVLMGFWVLFSCAMAMFQQNIVLFNQFHLKLSSRETSMVLAYIGIMVAFAQGVLLRWLTLRYSDDVLMRVAAPVMVVALVAWAWTPSLAWLYVILTPLCLAGSTLIAVTNSALSKACDAADTGGVLGVAGFVDNASRALGGLLGGVLIDRIGTMAPGLAAAALALALGVFAVTILPATVTAAAVPRSSVETAGAAGTIAEGTAAESSIGGGSD
jgi:MFS transporter, DHA1 family, tetracycline resistance protein